MVVCLLLSSCANKQDKIDFLLSQMTLEEKCGQLTCPIGFNFYGKDGDSLWLADDFVGGCTMKTEYREETRSKRLDRVG